MKHRELYLAAEELSSYIDSKVSLVGRSFEEFSVKVFDRPRHMRALFDGKDMGILYQTAKGIHLSVLPLWDKDLVHILGNDSELVCLVQKFLIELVKVVPNKRVIWSRYHKEPKKITIRSKE